MDEKEEAILAIAGVVIDAVAMSQAALDRDFEEARFRAHLVVAEARTLNLGRVAVAAADVIIALGLPGESPRRGYGAAIARVSDELELVRLA